MAERIKIIGVETLAEDWGRLTRTTMDYRRADGAVQRFSREVYDHGSAAAVLLFNPERQTVLLVRQFRYPPLLNGDDPNMLEICAGLLDGEHPDVAARREAIEETGHDPANLVHVCDVYASPGSLTEKVALYIGHYGESTRRNAGGGIEAEGEEIELVELPFAEALAMIGKGRIIDAKTVITLQHLALTLR